MEKKGPVAFKYSSRKARWQQNFFAQSECRQCGSGRAGTQTAMFVVDYDEVKACLAVILPKHQLCVYNTCCWAANFPFGNVSMTASCCPLLLSVFEMSVIHVHLWQCNNDEGPYIHASRP